MASESAAVCPSSRFLAEARARLGFGRGGRFLFLVLATQSQFGRMEFHQPLPTVHSVLASGPSVAPQSASTFGKSMTAIDAMAFEPATLFTNKCGLGVAGDVAHDQQLGTASPRAPITQAVVRIRDKGEQLVFASAAR